MPRLDRFFALALVRRTFGLWVGAHMVVAATMSPGGLQTVSQTLIQPNPLFLLVVPAIAAVELKRRREFLFFATLGISRSALIGLSLGITLFLEIALAAVAGA